MSRSDMLEMLGGYQRGLQELEGKEMRGGSSDLEMVAARSEKG